ncbi:protein associated with UVRAG as autophagy enhancer isoform X1 [Polypterus senegalus]|uniref:protein associated with UVRAG as autophagy enhancer isoform X1 n=1 Tax=Polypterus senegalus TaxID=55291 RepID=UPI0019629869|nr:protein associated with UVRAG as autophagy enhancer isoform X1 [Polypterus senegalus]XP_039601188.1 protein associated with UVRAG as autophagy enhancer isoform X1 [Polypterus senegalus]
MESPNMQMIGRCNHILPVPQTGCSNESTGFFIKKAFCISHNSLTSVLSGEYSKPAVIGHCGCLGRDSVSPAVIREILMSVLETSREVKDLPIREKAISQNVPILSRRSSLNEEEIIGENNSGNDDGYSENSYTSILKDLVNFDRIDNFDLDVDFNFFPLPRSSPVISQKSRQSSISQSTLNERSTSHETSSNSKKPDCPSLKSTNSCKPDDISQDAPKNTSFSGIKQRSNILTANFSRLFPVGLHIPLRNSGFMEGVWGNLQEGLKSRSHSESNFNNVAPVSNAEVDKESVISEGYIQETLKASADLDKENAHFIVVDMVLAELENIKCNVMGEKRDYIKDNILGGSYQDFHSASKKHSESIDSSDSGYEGLQPSEIICSDWPDCIPTLNDEVIAKTLNLGEKIQNTDSTEHSGRSSFGSPSFNSAETLAQQLVRIFRKQWLHTEGASGTTATKLQEFLTVRSDITTTEDSLNLAEEIRLKSRMRGTLLWAPPRFQIIFSIHEPLKREVVLISQNYLCAGCGTEVEPRYIKKLRYCEYLGKYFCDCCHNNLESVIPGRIILKWDFSKYTVCNFSKQLLDSIWENPLFNVCCVNKKLYSKAKELDRFREVQEQLMYIKKLLKTCRFSERVLLEFEQLPNHLTEELHVFSLDDFVKVKRGLLITQAKTILKTASSHVDTCELCQAKGFICEFCKSKDVIFPFQIDICKRCDACRACFHKDCFQSEHCPRCLRIQARKILANISETTQCIH